MSCVLVFIYMCMCAVCDVTLNANVQVAAHATTVLQHTGQAAHSAAHTATTLTSHVAQVCARAQFRAHSDNVE